MTDKYEQLLEKCTASNEKMNIVSDSLLEVSKKMEINIKELNDNFIFHRIDSNKVREDIYKEVVLIRKELFVWLKWSVVALVIAVGGQRIIELIINFIK